jgi:hypothetical protein
VRPLMSSRAGSLNSCVVMLASLRVHLGAIQAAHRLAGIALDLKDPRLARVLEGIARTNGVRPRKRVAAATPDALGHNLLTKGRPTLSCETCQMQIQ